MIVIAILGLLVPGYVLARLRSPVPWAIAFPLSALLLAQIVIAYTLLGIPIRFGYVFDAVIIVTVICLAVDLRRKAEAGPTPINTEPQDIFKPFVVLAAFLVGLALLGIVVRSTLYPLSGPDTLFRWDALPRLMLEYQDLSYYPPTTAEDFSKYTYPDSFPPLVATVYWWLYAAWGSAFPRITSVAIFLQAASCFALVFYAARTLFGTSGAVLSSIVLSSTAMFLIAIANGQENGYTAISVAGQLLFAFAATREPRVKFVVIAGLFAGLGAVTREYGPLLSLSGLIVLAIRRQTLRLAPLFCLISAVCGGPWFIRNWVIAGNPLYSLDLGLGFRVNPVHVGFMSVYHEILGLKNYNLDIWLFVAKAWLIGAPLALFIGVPGIAVARKHGIALGLTALLIFLLWISSVPRTSGGVIYTWRILTPAWVTLSIAAGAFGYHLLRPTLSRKPYLKMAAASATIVCAGYALGCCWTQPHEVTDISWAVVSARDDPLEFYGFFREIAKKFEELAVPAVKILAEDCNLAVVLKRTTRFQPVMEWSPEVAFLFDPKLAPAEAKQRLLDKNICFVAVSYSSLNNKYLMRYAFFKDGFYTWESVLSVPNQVSIVFLPNQSKAGPDKTPIP